MAAVRLKPLNEQVMVITGATSGIGLVTARKAAERGARLVLAARSDNALARLVDEITAKGGKAIHVEADVADEHQVEQIAHAAIRDFGGFDTWFNNAGASVYGKITEVSIEDMRRVFETNFWGVVYGSRVAVKTLRERGGALINMGSVASDRAIPLQGIYSASKHAVKGFTDALRVELENDNLPVAVTLIKPTTIDTPYTEHAKSYLADAPTNPGPAYAPDVVADAVLYCAEHAKRDVLIGGSAKAFSASGSWFPAVGDKITRMMARKEHSGKPARPRDQEALHKAGGSLQERGDYEGHVMESSLYTRATLHPVVTGMAALGIGLALSTLIRAKK